MNRADQTAVVIPCLNEGRNIQRVVTAARDILSTVYVVDDGSIDDTSARAKEGGAIVTRHRQSRGKGNALKTGFTRALADGFCSVVCLDGDGQHLPSEINNFLQEAEKTGSRMIVGNRMAQCENMPTIRRLVNRWMSRTLSNLCQQEIPDSQCGFRFVDLNLWNSLELDGAHFEVESELLVKAIFSGALVRFVPISCVYTGSSSKIHLIRDTLRWFRWYGRMKQFYSDMKGKLPKLAIDQV